MDGLAQSEYAHRTVSGLQGPRVNLTYRWVAQHAASCPLAGVVGCVLPTCAHGLVEPSSRGRNINGSFWGVWSSFCLSLCFSSWLTLGCLKRRWRLSRRCRSPKKRSFYFFFCLFKGGKLCSFFIGKFYFCCTLLNVQVTKREPTPGYNDACSVGTHK